MNYKKLFLIFCLPFSSYSFSRVSIEKNLENLPECRNPQSWKKCKQIQDNVLEFKKQSDTLFKTFHFLNFTDSPYFQEILRAYLKNQSS